jgi:hydrogenase maturation protease
MDRNARIITVGNPYRGDDGVGPYVFAGLAQALPGADLVLCDGEVSSLLDAFGGCAEVLLVDAMDAASAGQPAGSVVRLDGEDAALAEAGLRTSTHAMSVAEAIGLARSLGALPKRLSVIAIVGESFAHGAGLSAAVARAADELIKELTEQYYDA